jgi:hypothetical protein
MAEVRAEGWKWLYTDKLCNLYPSPNIAEIIESRR